MLYRDLVALLLAAVGWMVEAHHRGESFRVRLFLLDRRWLWAMFVPFAATNLRSLVSTPLHNIILMSVCNLHADQDFSRQLCPCLAIHPEKVTLFSHSAPAREVFVSQRRFRQLCALKDCLWSCVSWCS